MVILTFLGIVSGALVVTSVSTVYSVLWLVTTFIIVSILLGFLNLGFPALLYVIVYVGAIAILFLFVIQLLDLGNDSAAARPNTSNINNYNNYNFMVNLLYIIALVILALVVLVQVSLLHVELLSIWNAPYALANHLIDTILNYNYYEVLAHSDNKAYSAVYYTNMLIPDMLSSSQAVFSEGQIQVQSLSDWLYGTGLLPLIIISIILLLAMIAPISLCKDNVLD